MSISAASTAQWAEYTPQVMQAKQASLGQQIGIAVLAKSQDVQEVQGAAVLQMLQAAAQVSGVGGQLDVRG